MNKPGVLTSEEIEKLFTDGTVILFKCEVTDDFPLTFVSENCSDILGFSSSYFLENEHGWSERIHPDDKAEVFSQFRKVIEQGGETIAEYRFKRKDGIYIWLRDELKLVDDKNGDTMAILGSSFDITDRKRAEIELRENKEQYKLVVEHIKDITYHIDEDMKWTLLNQAWVEITGYPLQEALGSSFLEFIHPDDREICERTCNDLLNGKSDFYSRIVRLMKRNGSCVWVEMSARKTNGVTICENCNISGTMVNVTAELAKQKETRQELINEKRFSEAIIESLPGVFYMLDEQSNFLKWNENLVEQFGYTGEEIAGMNPSDFFEEAEFKKIAREIKRVFKEGESEVEAVALTKNGTKIPYYLTGKRFEQNEKKYLIGAGYDLSERKRAIEKLKKSEELFRNLFLKAPAAIVMADVENKVLRVNQSFEELFGYTESEIADKDLNQFIVPEGAGDKIPALPEHAVKRAYSYHQVRRKTKTGEMKDVSVGIIPIYIDDKPYVVFGMYIDVTEQKRYENQIAESLKEKQVLLQEIHHRVKNNLAVISGLIQLQMYEIDHAYMKQLLQESQSRIQTMALIHEKLYQSQNLSRISCRSYIEELIQTIRSTFDTGAKKIKINTEIEDVELNINKAVPFALLLNEVISNAFEHAFSGRRQGSISVSLSEEDADIHVSIMDDGVGMPDDFAIEGNETLGMTLIHNFLEQLEAEWELSNENGTSLSLTFSKEYVKGSSTTMV